jgi:large subunit ribosomal protein L21e
MSSKKAKGKRAKSRDLMKKRGSKPTVNKLLKTFEIGSTVHIKLDSSIHSGLPALIFQGKTGVIKAKKGSCYVVELYKGNKKSEIIVSPAHLLLQEANKLKLKKSVQTEKKSIEKEKKLIEKIKEPVLAEAMA